MGNMRAPLGLSFEIAAAAPAHALRMDVACFVGTIARRRTSTPPTSGPMPLLLGRWLESQGIDRIGGTPVAMLRVALDSAQAFRDSLGAPGDAAVARALASLDDALEELLRECRNLAPVPAGVLDDLSGRGFFPGGQMGPDAGAACLRLQRLFNVPIVVDSFADFAALFAWERRGIMDRLVRVGDPVVATPLGAAVRAFFGEGGRRAIIVRTGDPSDVFDSAASRFSACFPEPQRSDDATVFDRDADRCAQMPGISRNVRLGMLTSVVDLGSPPALAAADWRGLEHVHGLPEASFVLLPDLIDASAQAVPAHVPPPEAAAASEEFADCCEAKAVPEGPPAGRRLPPPRANSLGLETWRALVVRALAVLGHRGPAAGRDDVQLLVSLPLCGEGRGMPTPATWLEWMVDAPGWMDAPEPGRQAFSASSLQVAYPWLVTTDSIDCQGGVEAPEGSLAGILARNALARGTFRSAAGQPARRYRECIPPMPWTQVTRRSEWTPLGNLALSDRVCLIGPTPHGAELLSDVDCSADAATRQGSVRRLMDVVLRAAREAGDEFAFEVSGDALWARVRERIGGLMRSLLRDGALAGGTPFQVRCGRDTMRQNDIDAGRLIAEVEFQPAQPVQRIVVRLNLRDAGAAPARAA